MLETRELKDVEGGEGLEGDSGCGGDGCVVQEWIGRGIVRASIMGDREDR